MRVRRNQVPGSTRTSATLAVEVANRAYTQGLFESPDDSDWYRVRLEKGKHYYVAVDGSGDEGAVRAAVRNASGKVLSSRVDDPYVEDGFGFLAPYTGAYFVEYRLLGGVVGAGYRARVSTDCAGSKATTCVQLVGQTRKSLLGGAYDSDWFKASLSARKTYTATAEPLDGCASGFRVLIADSGGTFLTDPSAGRPTVERFRPPRDGTYFLAVSAQDDCSMTYSLSLRTP
jgi:hypothetical protein